VFGGANFDGDMGLELVRAVDCVDYAVIGEGDRAFPALLAALAAGAEPGAIPGVAYRTSDGAVVSTPAEAPLSHLDASPVPDYDEYFERAERLALLPRAVRRHVWIPFESARGCWWGAKHHCTFCGLNGNSMAFRAKSPGRVLDELGRQARRYHSFRFQAVDNILDLTYLKQLFPVLVESDTNYDIFYEVKANLSRAQLRLLAQAGVGQIQPGIESLSSRVLQLMRKGVRAAQNVNLLRWAQYYRIDVGWNILWGFPGESEQDYADQVRIIGHLRHLTPPSNVTRVWMERFSPLYREREALRMAGVRPEPSYRYVYPDGVDLERVAYFFEYELPVPPPGAASRDLTDAVSEWQNAWRAAQRPALTYRSAPGFVQIHDDRGNGPAGVYAFEDKLAEIYLACVERPTTAAAVRERIGSEVPAAAIEEAFGEFEQRGLMFLDGTLALALALPAVPAR
jgi:ribosomal peptide maturation radical SAM protein 1